MMSILVSLKKSALALVIPLTLVIVCGGLVATQIPSPEPTKQAEVASEVVTVVDPVAMTARSATVRIRVQTCGGWGVGSGFLIDETTIVTNQHVVEGYVSLDVLTADGDDLAPREVHVSRGTDLATITIEGHQQQTLQFGPTLPGRDVHITAVGYPGGRAITHSKGVTTAITDGGRRGSAGKVIEFDASIEPGNSGGPLIDDLGTVIGVVYAVHTRSDHGYAVSSPTATGELAGRMDKSLPDRC